MTGKKSFMRIPALSRLILAACLALFLLAPAQASDHSPWSDWRAPLLTDHPLTGKIWSAGEKRFITPQALGNAVQEARFLLLGEVHDNADVHRLQAWLIAAAARDRKPALVLEMIPRNLAGTLQSYLAKPGASAAGLGPAVTWEARGWPDWSIYRPIANAAFVHGLAIHAGDVDRETRKKVGMQGLDTLESGERQSLLLATELGNVLTEDLIDELFESHCKLVPRAAMTAMLGVQRLRDAVLADSLIEAAGPGSAILIAGNGHVRRDRAVPWYLARRLPRASIVTVMVMEVQEDVSAAAELVPASPDGKPRRGLCLVHRPGPNAKTPARRCASASANRSSGAIEGNDRTRQQARAGNDGFDCGLPFDRHYMDPGHAFDLTDLLDLLDTDTHAFCPPGIPERILVVRVDAVHRVVHTPDIALRHVDSGNHFVQEARHRRALQRADAGQKGDFLMQPHIDDPGHIFAEVIQVENHLRLDEIGTGRDLLRQP